MSRWLLVLYFCFLPLWATEEIVVHLTNASPLSPLYLLPIEATNSNLSASTLTALSEVLAFDFAHNGKTALLPESRARAAQAKTEGTLHFDPEAWKRLGCDYVIKPTLSGRTLSLSCYAVAKGRVRGNQEVVLTGELAKDRRLLHRAADAAHAFFFGVRGVCDTRILYTVRTREGSDSSSWISEVWEADYDGANAHQVTHQRTLCVTPTYLPSPTGGPTDRILYVSYQIGQPKIYAASTRGGDPVRLTYMRGNQLMPALSPRKDCLALISDITGNPDLFVQDFSLSQGVLGKPRQVFTAPYATQGTPTFSPDGSQIAFVSNKEGTARIYLLSLASGNGTARLLSRRNRDNTSPAWSPDGTKIAYSAAGADGTRQIWIYDCATQKEMPLTEGYGHKENPAWAPDSLHLLFNSSSPTHSELFLLNLNQKESIQLTRGPGEKRFPAWEPISLTYQPVTKS